MRILDKLDPSAVLCDLKARDKKGVIEELAGPVADIAKVPKEKLVKVLLERERLGSTGIGGGIGIPHGKMRGIEDLLLGFGVSRQGVDFDSMDGKPAHLFFLLVTPEDSAGLHLSMLARISRLLKNDLFRESLLNAENPRKVLEIIGEVDEDF
ncbi:MAG: PTS sugar transporter subunit IIA [Deltaproteobacteria bacterium]|nr:PTS sugar transporter subunit IIA [Deltaproteobacteria bacterium]MBW1988538.1 PTS sugar transporter subunit IIA [Deltaproteobacteria bacterium]